MNYNVDENGYYGRFGGAYIPEILHANVEQLQREYLRIMDDPAFQKEFHDLLTDYVGRPSPLTYAPRMSQRYGTRIYLKREDLNHTGAHKINNTIGQILLARRMGKTRIIAETGAGQHGVAAATVCALMGMQCIVYMGATDVKRQHLNVQKMQMLGAEVRPVTSGNMTLKDATNEAIRDWCCNPADTHYIIGSTVGPHPYPDMVARFQSVISAEIKKQLLAKEGRDYPDYLIACVGGGSNAMGMFSGFLNDPVEIYGVEPLGRGPALGDHAASLCYGSEGVMHGFNSLMLKDADGNPAPVYSAASGLDYPSVGPEHAYWHETGREKAAQIGDEEAIEAFFRLSRLEGIIPALESAHAVAFATKLARERPTESILVNLSGRGDKDLDYVMEHFGEYADREY